ncbi:lipase family protein [Bradyrhizobium liaoningense]|uniref:lipase family protein n=1 Tax=Bradyrhizobium liaoningense TaxID=43992 RepID=UPI001BA840C5|nr:lipase family protein [Bradyrhizobium liaoningense]MBR0715853.1 lipase family protein [Bradyrhizobium liaoningense]
MSRLVELPLGEYDRDAFAKFKDDSTDFNLDTARAMMWMSQLAYETHVAGKIDDVAAFWNLSGAKPLIQPVNSTPELTDTRGVIARRGRATIIAFAGTDPLHLLNWLNNFTLGKPASPVHEGFRQAAAAVWKDVKAAIATALKDNSPIFLTGHSLGAAIAVNIADFARDELKLKNAQIYLYGCPRTGRADFVTPWNDTFGPTTYRLVNGTDVVPTVPPPQLNFLHVGRYLECGRAAKFEADRLTAGFDSNDPRADAGLLDQIVSLFRGRSLNTRADLIGFLSSILVPPGIGDHLPDRYCAALTPP